MEWILVICTAGWVMCGQEREVTYPSEAACYRAMDELYKRNRREDFKWVVCKPKSLNKPANTCSAAEVSLIPQPNTGLESENPE